MGEGEKTKEECLSPCEKIEKKKLSKRKPIKLTQNQCRNKEKKI